MELGTLMKDTLVLLFGFFFMFFFLLVMFFFSCVIFFFQHPHIFLKIQQKNLCVHTHSQTVLSVIMVLESLTASPPQ